MTLEPGQTWNRLASAAIDSLAAQHSQIDKELLNAEQERLKEPVLSYLSLLERWNEVGDLVSPAPSELLLERHFVDSLVVAFLVRAKLQVPANLSYLDVGSGAGFPGVLLALVEPKRSVILCEARKKRGVFLKEVRRSLGLDCVSVRLERLENLSKEALPQLGLLITRAFGQQDFFLRQALRLLPPTALVAQLVGPSFVQGAVPSGLRFRDSLPYFLPPRKLERAIALWEIDCWPQDAL